ncbi:MAG: GntR family transcriptional regulator [Clostridia bacterium]|jgi:DNA-binding transcriptional regulator YhcF (GntR family)|nr:GntR family transcriptional regulator [Clostridia bacterium]
MEFDKSLPIYEQIKDRIRVKIIKGDYKPGDKLLSTREYAIKLSVNPNTMSRVFKDLEIEGVVFTKRGLGTFISEDKDLINNIKDEMLEDIVLNFIKSFKELNYSVESIKNIFEKKIMEGKNEQISN